MDPYRPLTPEACDEATSLLRGAPFAALATTFEGAPLVTRAGCLWIEGVGLTLLLSELSDHSKALAADPTCAVLVGEPGPKGDPLTHPRLTLRGRAVAVDKAEHRERWLTARPKAGLYYDFTDFRLVAIHPADALLNGGFGKAFRLAPDDL